MASKSNVNKWLSRLRKRLLAENNGCLFCKYCKCILLDNELTLDHLKPRMTHPELEKDESNIVPACFECNQNKRHKSDEEFMKMGVPNRAIPKFDKFAFELSYDRLEFLESFLYGLDTRKAALHIILNILSYI